VNVFPSNFREPGILTPQVKPELASQFAARYCQNPTPPGIPQRIPYRNATIPFSGV